MTCSGVWLAQPFLRKGKGRVTLLRNSLLIIFLINKWNLQFVLLYTRVKQLGPR